MPSELRSPRLAVLIDADNASAKIADGLFEEIAKIGEASVRRIYGDFSSARSKGWADILSKHAIIPAAAVRLYDRKKCVRYHPRHRRDGLAAQRPVRRVLPGFVRQRFYAACRPHPRAGRRCIRIRRAEDAGELQTGLPKIYLYREFACRSRRAFRMRLPRHRRFCRPRQLPRLSRRSSPRWKTRTGGSHLGKSENGSSTWPPISIREPMASAS